MKWTEFWNEFSKKEEIKFQTREVKTLAGAEPGSTIFTLAKKNYIDNMHPDELLDIDYFTPNYSAHYWTEQTHWHAWFKDIRETSDYEEKIKILTSYIFRDATKIFTDQECLMDCYGENWYISRYKCEAAQRSIFASLHRDIEKNYGILSNYLYRGNWKHSFYFLEYREINIKNAINPFSLRSKKDLVDYIYNFINELFSNYVITKATEIERVSEYRDNAIRFTIACDKYRWIYTKDMVYPKNIKDFTGSVDIICAKHESKYTVNLLGYHIDTECPKCKAERLEKERLEREAIAKEEAESYRKIKAAQFIENATSKYGGFYNYDHVYDDFIDNVTPVRIIHPEMGEFKMTPKNHMRSKTGYPGHVCAEKSALSLPTEIKENTSWVGKDGNKISIGDDVVWEQYDNRPVIRYGTVVKSDNYYFWIEATNGKTYKKRHEVITKDTEDVA